MIVKTFLPRFHALVEAGVKRQTVRGVQHKPIVGEKISCRAWTGKPYRSKQKLLREGTVTGTRTILFDGATIIMDWPQNNTPLNTTEARNFAVADGFSDLEDMRKQFKKLRGLPFSGTVIYWK